MQRGKKGAQANAQHNTACAKQCLPDLPPSFFVSARCTLVDVSYNHLTALPSQFELFSNTLTKLCVAGNRLAHFPPIILTLVNLRELDLSYNFLKTLCVNLAPLKKLRSLNVSYNLLKHVENTILPGSLVTLNLAGNLLCVLPDTTVLNLKNLQTLMLTDNSIKAVQPTLFHTLGSLATLGLGGNRLKDLVLTSPTPPLTTLDLQRNMLNDEVFSRLSCLTSLVSLDLSENQLKAITPSVCSLAKLKVLDLHRNFVESGVEHLGSLTNLESLDLSNNILREIHTSLENLKHLTDIALYGNDLEVFPCFLCKMDSLRCFDIAKTVDDPIIPALVCEKARDMLKDMKSLQRLNLPILKPVDEVVTQIGKDNLTKLYSVDHVRCAEGCDDIFGLQKCENAELKDATDAATASMGSVGATPRRQSEILNGSQSEIPESSGDLVLADTKHMARKSDLLFKTIEPVKSEKVPIDRENMFKSSSIARDDQSNLPVDNAFPDSFDMPSDRDRGNVYVGSEYGASQLHVLQDLHITHVLVLGMELKPRYPEKLQYFHVEVDDNDVAPLSAFFIACILYIFHARLHGNILIHCHLGVSRSVSVLSAYLMACHGYNMQDSLALIKSCRSLASPNPGFLKQLEKFEKLLGRWRCEPQRGLVPPQKKGRGLWARIFTPSRVRNEIQEAGKERQCKKMKEKLKEGVEQELLAEKGRGHRRVKSFWN